MVLCVLCFTQWENRCTDWKDAFFIFLFLNPLVTHWFHYWVRNLSDSTFRNKALDWVRTTKVIGVLGRNSDPGLAEYVPLSQNAILWKFFLWSNYGSFCANCSPHILGIWLGNERNLDACLLILPYMGSLTAPGSEWLISPSKCFLGLSEWAYRAYACTYTNGPTINTQKTSWIV